MLRRLPRRLYKYLISLGFRPSCQFVVFRGGIRIVRAIAAIRAAGTQCALPLPVLEATQNCEEKTRFWMVCVLALRACLVAGCWLFGGWMDSMGGRLGP